MNAVSVNRTLFIYIDLDFSFRFGHYFNIFSNIYQYSVSHNFDIWLFHRYWLYHKEEDDVDFENFKIKAIHLTNPDLLKSLKTIENDLRAYDRVILYVYKGDLGLVQGVINVHDYLRSVCPKVFSFITLFTLPFKKIALRRNRFKGAFVKEIKQVTSLLPDSRFFLCYDLEKSIWNKYITGIKYLPPPIIDGLKPLPEKLAANKEEIKLGMDVWNLKMNPSNRFEDMSVLKRFIIRLLEKYPNLNISIKLADVNYQINENNDRMFFHPRIKIVRYLEKNEYYNYLNSCDIYLLQYAPIYYKNKSSGHLIELLLRDILLVGTKNTFLEDVIMQHKLGVCYKFGNFKDLLESAEELIDNYQDYKRACNRSAVDNYVEPWTTDGFFNRLLAYTNSDKPRTV